MTRMAAPDDLCVDVDRLDTSAETLATLKRAFASLPSAVGHQAQDWGHDAIAGAMHEFATNWDYRRGKLTEQIDEVGEKIESTRRTFLETDAKLASQCKAS